MAVIVCSENSLRIDLVTESPNVMGDDRPVKLSAGAARRAIQIEEPA